MMFLMKLKEAVYLPIIDKAEHSAKKSHISYIGELGPKEGTHPRKPAPPRLSVAPSPIRG
jgi:hypothetical protein